MCVDNYVGKVMEIEAEHSCMQAGIEEKILSELKGQSGETKDGKKEVRQ